MATSPQPSSSYQDQISPTDESDESTDTQFVPAEVMANILGSVFHPETVAYLDQLVETCLYGDDRVAVVIGLVDEGIRNAIKSGFIKSRTAK